MNTSSLQCPRVRNVLPVSLLIVMSLAGCSGRPPSVVETPPSPDGVDSGVADRRTMITHTVKTGETLSRIADNYYGDPDRAGMIARHNGLHGAGDPVPGSVLHLPFAPDEWTAAQRRAAALDPYNRGVQAFAQDRLGEAERLFRRAAETAPDLHDARYNLALVLLRRGLTDEATTLLRDLTASRPQEPEYRCAYGNTLFQATRFADAATQYARVLADRPGHQRAAFGLARSLQEAGRSAEAASAWRRYLELDSESGWADTARRNLRKLTDGG